MKQLALLMGVVMGLSLGAGAARAASTNALVVRFNLTAYTLKPEVTVTNNTTTNTVVGLNKVKFATPDFLHLLETAFSTNFPAGSQLGMDIGYRFVVLNKAGTVILDASSNPADSSYFLTVSNNVNSLFSGKISQTPKAETEVLKVLQPDFGIYYADGQGNSFHFGGLAYITATGVVTTNTTVYKTVSFLIPACTGGGTFLNPQDAQYEDTAFAGSLRASAANLPQESD